MSYLNTFGQPVGKKRSKRLGGAQRLARRRQVTQIYGYVCHLCDLSIPEKTEPGSDWCLSLDHVVPRSRGGSHKQENILPAHRYCNNLKDDEQELTEVQLIWVYRKAIREGVCRESVRERDYELLAAYE